MPFTIHSLSALLSANLQGVGLGPPQTGIS